MFLLGGAAVSWASKRQSSVTLSSCEAQYMAACFAAKEAIWIKKLLTELRNPWKGPIRIHPDSQSAASLIKTPIVHSRSKHIGIQYHYVTDLAESKEVSFTYCPTEVMVADRLTKRRLNFVAGRWACRNAKSRRDFAPGKGRLSK